jgi:Recombination endonuclease VII
VSARPKETEWQRRTRRDRERAEHVAEHGPGCQICGAIPKSGGLHQDHDHRTGKNRGWLCHRCNRGLPSWVTAEWLVSAALYLGGGYELFYNAAWQADTASMSAEIHGT